MQALLRRSFSRLAPSASRRWMSATPSRSALPELLENVEQVRKWRDACTQAGHSVGFVPTMGALHSGHAALVEASLSNNDKTIVSIFVNPAQFAPHEDLATYPRTLDADLDILRWVKPSQATSTPRQVDAVFLPPVEALYPGGISTDVSKQRGAFVEVKGLQEVMEGASRPGFFRGVATVVTKLFNIVEPDRAYFGQKDIQQAMILRRMLRDLHVRRPSPMNMKVMETTRDAKTGLALSSRNRYLTDEEREFATVLIDALRAGQAVWDEHRSSSDGVVKAEEVLAAARSHISTIEREASAKNVPLKGLYVAMNDPDELVDLEGTNVSAGKGAILSGAVMLGRTRLIDNLVFDYKLN